MKNGFAQSLTDQGKRHLCRIKYSDEHTRTESLLGKFSEIQMLLQMCKIDVLRITESHLNEKIKDIEITISGYDMSRCARTHKRGGYLYCLFQKRSQCNAKREKPIGNLG